MEHARQMRSSSISPPGHDPVRGVVVHYHEIGLKGRNRGFFERQLVRNLQRALEGCDHDGIEVLSGRLLVRTPDVPSSAVLSRIARTFGVAVFAPCAVTSSEIDAMKQAAFALLEPVEFASFAIAARRSSKELPLTSRQINVELGAAVEAASGARVNLGSPEATVHVEVVGRQSLVYVERHQGPGGLPLGSSGKVVALLSGGIDSPVATYRIMKRGARPVLCHFHSAPFTDLSSARKASELARLLMDGQSRTSLYLVPLGEAQQQIVADAPSDLRVLLYRRLMVRIAERIAAEEGARALVTGDSLGQVASQTLENLVCVDDAVGIPVLRPLIGEDKQEIVAQAQEIGTYETSILPYADCCSLFVPRSPATRAEADACRRAEDGLDIEAMVASCLSSAEVERIETAPCGDAA